jgi:DNA-binding transcriptional LysR family regulator
MADSTPAWDLYRSFLAVVQEGSLTAASRLLALTQPTVGRHVADLERALGQTLFVRGPTGLSPTPAALAIVPHAAAMAASAEALVRAASAAPEAEDGVVRLTASDFVGSEVLPPMLTAFREAHPGVVIELLASNANQDLSRRDADIAVRMARPTQGALLARKIGDITVGLFAHRRYVERHGRPESVEQLPRHAVIGFDAIPFGLRTAGLLNIGRDLFALRSDSEHARLAALRAGFGIGGCQAQVAARDPDLLPVLPDQIRFPLEMWLVMHEDLKSLRRVRLLYDFLADALTAHLKGRA